MNKDILNYVLLLLNDRKLSSYDSNLSYILSAYEKVLYKYKYDKYNMNDDDIYNLADCIEKIIKIVFNKDISNYTIRYYIATKIKPKNISIISDIITDFDLIKEEDIYNMNNGDTLMSYSNNLYDVLNDYKDKEDHKLDDAIISKINDYLQNKLEDIVEKFVEDKLDKIVDVLSNKLDTIIDNKLNKLQME